MPVKSVFGEIRPLHVLEIEISSPHFDTEGTLKIEAGVTRNLSPPLLLGNDIFAKYPGIFSRRESDALNNNKGVHSSGTSTPAPRAEVEQAEESSEIETRAAANPAAAAAAAVAAAAAATATVTADAATSSKAVIYDVDIATRARNYDPVCGENSSDGSLQRSGSAREARVRNKLFHRDQIINTDADSHHLNLSPAVSTNDTGRRANNKNRGPKNPGSEASVRRDHGTKSDTHRLETDQKQKSDINTAKDAKMPGRG